MMSRRFLCLIASIVVAASTATYALGQQPGGNPCVANLVGIRAAMNLEWYPIDATHKNLRYQNTIQVFCSQGTAGPLSQCNACTSTAVTNNTTGNSFNSGDVMLPGFAPCNMEYDGTATSSANLTIGNNYTFVDSIVVYVPKPLVGNGCGDITTMNNPFDNGSTTMTLTVPQ